MFDRRMRCWTCLLVALFSHIATHLVQSIIFGEDDQVERPSVDPDSNLTLLAHERLLTNLNATLRAHYNLNLLLDRHDHLQWLAYADSATQVDTLEAAMESAALLRGVIMPRYRCNHINTLNDDQCLYFRRAEQLRSSGLRLNSSALASKWEDNLQLLHVLAVDLFRDKWYLHSHSLSLFILHELLPAFWPNCPQSKAKLIFCYNCAMLCSRLVSEADVMVGELETASDYNAFGVQLLRQLLAVDVEQKQMYQAKLIGFHVRRVIATPPFPFETAQSLVGQKVMMDDMRRMQESFDANRDDIPAEVLVKESDLSCPFHVAHQGLPSLPFQGQWQALLASCSPTLLFNSPHLDEVTEKSELRFGLLSSYFREHSIGLMLVETMAFLRLVGMRSGTRPVRVIVYSMMEVGRADDQISSSLRQYFNDDFVQLHCKDIPQARQRIVDDRLDFLLYADLGMDMCTQLLAFSRLAIYQGAWWGHPITSGLPSVDFFFGTDDEVLQANEDYSEQLVRMKFVSSVPFIYEKAEVDLMTASDWMSAGLPCHSSQQANCPLAAVILGRLFKLHPDFIDMLVALLGKVVQSDHRDASRIAILFFAERNPYWNQMLVTKLRDSLKKNFVAQGVANSTDMVHMAMQHVRLLTYSSAHYEKICRSARMVLDTFPYGGCTTIHNALHCGTPVLTNPKNILSGRFGLSMYNQMNYTELVSLSDEEFIDKAMRLLLDDEYHANAAAEVKWRFKGSYRKNEDVAKEWLGFVRRLFAP